MIPRANWPVLLICTTIFLIYCNINIRPISGPRTLSPVNKDSEIIVQKIVAYSLKKQIELEGEPYLCDQKLFKNVTFERRSGKSDEFWRNVKNTGVYISSVILDYRLQPYYYLRMTGVIEGSWEETIYCQILTNDGHVQVSKATVTPIWYNKWDSNDNNTYYNPILISCRLPILENDFVPAAYSISKKPCEPSEEFNEISRPLNRRSLRNFTLCIKPLSFKKDISKHLVHWIEICKILGAEYFHIFIDKVPKTTRKVLEWYKSEYPNIIHLEEFKPLSNKNRSSAKTFLQRTWQRRRYEIVAYNKCFYENINSKYVIPLDIDELIVPKTADSWQELVRNLDNYSSLIVQNVYFFRNDKKNWNEPFFLKENTRAEVASKKGENSKSFITTKNTLTVFNHYALRLLRPGAIREYFLPFEDVQLNHYKEFCNSVIFPECFKYLSSPRIVDNVMFKYRDKFNDRYRDVIRRIENDGIKIF